MNRVRALTAASAVLAAVALALLPAAGASAHDYLVSSDPASGATVTAPLEQVALTFNDRVLDLTGDGKSSIVEVTDAAGRYFETGCATTADTVVTAPVALGPAGSYTITYQIVSADGHTVSNSLPFTYQPAAGAVAAEGSARPTCGQAVEPTPSPTEAVSTPGPTEAVTTPAPIQAADDSGNLGLVIGIGVGIVVLALAGVLIVVLTSRRKPPAPDAEHPADDDGPVV
ncbi:copper resistance protein CopC [Leifsonia sp. NPDC058230]|uniref:copper resistance CopC family protein n=1 Tax=Leifsonia sp. NPDC058230 TaxID=3346391 RepID=UPI0036D98F5F